MLHALTIRPALAALLLVFALSANARAAVLPAVTIDGPDPAIGALGGVAMAQDGSGGVVYQRAVDGRQHVFAAQFVNGRWGAPQRVDTSLPFDSAWPRIGAANGGRLVVVWAQQTAEGANSLYSAVLDRGATSFLPPTLIDFKLGLFTAVYPSLAMDDAGNALVAYRAVDELQSPDLPDGYVNGEVRVARFNGSRWQRLGVPANRNRAAPQETPTADNAPQVAIDATGNGAVTWQEPDDSFVSRVWARRIFGTRFGIALAASPLTVDGQLNAGAADRPAIAETPLGRVVVGFRQLPDARNRSAAPQLLVNQLDESTVADAGAFSGPQLVGDAGDSPASVDVDTDDTIVGYSQAGQSMLGFAPDLPGPVAVRQSDQIALAAPPPGVVAGVAGRKVLASASDSGGGEVLVSEFDGNALAEREPVSTSPGGPIRELATAGSGLGDALVAFAQGVDNDRQIAVSVVDSAPAPFLLTLPVGWTHARRPVLSWEAAGNALGQVVYTVSIDGRRIARTRGLTWRLREGAIDQGQHTVKVVATDPQGQDTAADPGAYALDRAPPVVHVTVRKRTATVTVDDGHGARASGIETDTSSVTDWGDDATTDAFTKRATHRFTRAGTFKVEVSATDAAHNRIVVDRTIRVR
jgi:hypothetical protein